VVQVVARLSVAHGLSYPQTRSMAVRIVPQRTLTRAQILLVEAIVGEDEWTRWVKSRAKVWDWRGVHLRDSEGVMESVHITRLDGFSEALGQPDWRFWHEELGESFDAELKGKHGTLSKDQKRTIPSMRRGGIVVFTWWPRDWREVEHVFQYGLEGRTS
jgi:hypothetical protein